MTATAAVPRSASTARRDRVRLRMPQRLRKSVLVLHIVSSVGWLGLSLGNLILAATAITTNDPATQHAVYRVVAIFAGTILIPISLTAFGTGLLLGLGTKWGLVRYRWVLVKLILTGIAVLLTPLSFAPGAQAAAEAVALAPFDQLADTAGSSSGMMYATCVSSTMYLTCTLLSVFKPWGRVRR